MNEVATDPVEQALCRRFESCLPDAVNSDQHLVWRGRYFSADVLIQIGSTPFLLSVREGRVVECRRGLPLLHPTAFTVRATAEAWQAFWADPPKPKWHDIFALTKFGHMSVEGNLQPFIANLQYVKDVLASPRKAGAK